MTRVVPIRAASSARTVYGAPPRACKRPLCGTEVAPAVGRSRPPLYCSNACRKAYARERAAARAALAEAQRVAAQYGVESAVPRSPRPRSARTTATTEQLALGLIAQALALLHAEIDSGASVDALSVLNRVDEAKVQADQLLLASHAGSSRPV